MTEQPLPTYQSTGTVRRRVLVIYNPIAGARHGGLFRRTLAALGAEGATVTLKPTTQRGDAEAFAGRVRPSEYDAVVAAGGDGTINEVVNGLGRDAPPLGIIPLGTANVLAQEIDLPRKAESIARAVARGHAKSIYFGVANGRRFLLMAGVGFDAHVVAGVGSRLKAALGKGAYVWRSLVEMVRFGYPAYRITIDGLAHDAASVVVAKGHFYGGRFIVAPDADLTVPDFQVCILRRRGRLAALQYSLAMMAGTLPTRQDVTLVRGTRITIEGPPGDPVQADGDIVGELPMTIDIGAEPVRMLFPGSP